MKLSFHGAARGVTGSCHMLEAGGLKLLIDCGLYQGRNEIEDENSRPLGFDPDAIDHLLLTHAHLDHCGRIPLLAIRGFRGEIVSTAATREQSRKQAYDSMLDHAAELGANGIVGVRYDASEVVSKGSATEVLCYGTAVVLAKL